MGVRDRTNGPSPSMIEAYSLTKDSIMQDAIMCNHMCFEGVIAKSPFNDRNMYYVVELEMNVRSLAPRESSMWDYVQSFKDETYSQEELTKVIYKHVMEALGLDHSDLYVEVRSDSNYTKVTQMGSIV